MCHCSRLLYCLGNLSYIFQRLASCCALTAVVSCLITTLIVMLAIGVGLGYNYCYVDHMSGRGEEDADDIKREDITAIEVTPSNVNEKVSKALGRSLVEIKPTMRIPLSEAVNIPLLIQRIRESNRNITLHLTI